MTGQELVKALRACATYDDPDCSGCPMAPLAPLSDESKSCVDRLMEAAADDLEEMRASRDTWKKRAEAAVQDLRSVIRYADKGCELCAHYIPCTGKDCPQYISGTGATGQDGKQYPDFKWTCDDFEYGQCPAMENTPCNGCDFKNHWQWRGSCAENGGAK